TLLPADLPARQVLEEAFFGREVFDVVAGEGPARAERHERHRAWQARLRRQGFLPVDLTPSQPTLQRGLALARAVAVVADEGALKLEWKGTPLLAASAWRPGLPW